MRRVILQNYVTLDGFAADAQGELSFAPTDQQLDEDLLRSAETLDTILLGRKTYELFSQFWPQTKADTEIVADFINATPKIVFSRTLQRAPWGDGPAAQVVSGEAAEELRTLKAQPGQDMIMWGSLSLAHGLMGAGLIDEYQVRVCPNVLGKGKKLWPDGALDFKLVETKAYGSGVVLLRYQPARATVQLDIEGETGGAG